MSDWYFLLLIFGGWSAALYITSVFGDPTDTFGEYLFIGAVWAVGILIFLHLPLAWGLFVVAATCATWGLWRCKQIADDMMSGLEPPIKRKGRNRVVG